MSDDNIIWLLLAGVIVSLGLFVFFMLNFDLLMGLV
jgi:hypothetical protein